MEHSQDAALAVLSHKVDSLHHDVTDMKSALKDVANALNKLTLVEERQSQANANQKRMSEKLDKIEARVDALEKSDVTQSQAATWVMNAVWGAAGLLAMYAAKMLGLL
jgi:1-deoxy-D-xylulose 5-phosphate reductoisomerase